MRYHVIPDVHADWDRLEGAMSLSGFSPSGRGFKSTDGSKALFLGDLIDNGQENLRVVNAVRSMVDAGDALCIMGNHELNAILLHHGFRERGKKNLKQHASFLAEAPFDSPEAKSLISWFETLPVHAEFEDFRLVHAYWNTQMPKGMFEKEGAAYFTRITPDDYPHLASETGERADAFLDAMKGPDLSLPEGEYGFSDHYGQWRTKGRARWWAKEPQSWEEAFLSLGDERLLPEGVPFFDKRLPEYGPDEKPVFVGHYKMRGVPHLVSQNVLCLDYPERNLVYHHETGYPLDLADLVDYNSDESPKPND